MDITNCLPSPPQLLRLAMSLLNASVLGPRCLAAEAHRSPTEFDVHINEDTGFFPPRPLARLPAVFRIWETALEEATQSLVLGDNDWDANKTKAGERWRAKIVSVSTTFMDAYEHVLTCIVNSGQSSAQTFFSRNFASSSERIWFLPGS